MSKTYGASRSFGATTYSCSGFDSREEALRVVYRRAFQAGDWKPRTLRTRWWQIWRPVKHDPIEAYFASQATGEGE